MKVLLFTFAIGSIFAFFASAKMLPNWVHNLNSKGYDKHAHFLMFCVLQVACSQVFKKTDPLSIAAYLCLLGAITEIGQHYLTTERSGDINDLFADMAGVLFALFLIQLFNKNSILSQ